MGGGEPCQDPVPPPSPPPAPVVPEEKIPGWGIALIVIFSAMSVVMLLCFGIVISRERVWRRLPEILAPAAQHSSGTLHICAKHDGGTPLSWCGGRNQGLGPETLSS